MPGLRFRGETGFEITTPRTKTTIVKRSPSKGHETESLRQKVNKAAIEHFAEPLETSLIRHELYQKTWEEFRTKITEYEDRCVSSLIQQVVTFVASNIRSYEKPKTDTAEIPAGFLITGENKRLMSSILKEVLCSPDDVSLVRVSSNKCPNVKSAFQNVAKQLVYGDPNVTRFIGETRVEDPDADESEELDSIEESNNEKQRYLSIHDLNTWYNEATSTPYVLIVLDDVDVCPEGVIGELLVLLKCLKFPLTLLLGITSRVTPLSKFFPDDLAEAYRIEKFFLPNPTESLDNFIEQALYDLSSPFRLSGRVVQLFRSYFLNCHFSTARLLQLYQMCLMEHFRKPESIFCQKDVTTFWKSDSFLKLSREHFLETVEQLPGFSDIRKDLAKKRNKSPSKSPKKKGRIVNDEFGEEKTAFLDKLKACYKEILEWYESFLVLFQFGHGLPENPIGKTKTDLYIALFSGSLYKDDKTLAAPISPFRRVLQLIKNFSVTELESRLNAAYNEIQDFQNSNAGTKLVDLHLSKGIPYAILSFKQTILSAANADKVCTPKGSISAKTKKHSTRTSTKASKNTSSLEVIKKLQANVDREKAGTDSEVAKVRDDVVQFFELTITKRLKSMTEIPLAEVYVFDDVRLVEKQLFPNIPKEIHVALSLPQRYLNCDCCKDTQLASNHSGLPDASIVYKLLLEQNYHIVDLNALFMAFKSFHESNTPKRRTSLALKVKQAEDEDLLLRFGQAYEELRFLGLIQRKNRKPDEATRLSWIF